MANMQIEAGYEKAESGSHEIVLEDYRVSLENSVQGQHIPTTLFDERGDFILIYNYLLRLPEVCLLGLL